MRHTNKYIDTVVKFVTFADMPIKQKFLIFSLSVAMWFGLLTAIGYMATQDTYYRIILTVTALAATVLLVVFSICIAMSLAMPIKAMTEQIKSLSEGEVDLTKKIEVSSSDEIGELSKSFNILLDTIYESNMYRKVIEEDDNAQDIYKRLGNMFVKLGLGSFQIYEVANSRNVMRPMYASDESAEDTCNRDMLLNCNLCRAKKTGDIVSSINYAGICKHFLIPENKHHVCIPMIIGDSTGGIVKFLFPLTTEADSVHSPILRAHKFIKESLPVLEAKRLTDTLKESSLRDPHTGLYNRRFLEEYSETLVATTLRRGTNMGILMCDLDFFKEVNDTYGHNVGDMVLKHTSAILSESIRSSDMMIRFGGEEFLAILQDAKEGEAHAIAEKIRTRIEDSKVKIPRGFIQKTISIGVAEFPKDTANFWQSVKYADIALYKAKDGGRNQTVRFAKEMWSSEEY